MKEPLHDSKSEAIEWVLDNTGDRMYRDPLTEAIVRVRGGLTIMMLHKDVTDGKWFWSDCREV